MPKKIIVISGATACGKSALALELGNYKDIAIINADSLQVYQGLPILSAQPSKTEQEKLPHFLYSHFMPNESCSVGLWLKLVKTAATQIASEGKLPVVVGGSGMYISKLIEGISKMPEVTSEKKQEAAELYETLGHDEFQQQFGEEKIIDRQRLIRACEVFLQSGKPISFWQKQKKEKIFPDTKFTHVNLEIERKKLYQNCNLRFEKMLQAGGLNEVEDLLKLDPKRSWQITKTLGFEEISLFLQNEITHEKMLEIATQKTRNYAKRQMTWFRHQLPEKTNFEDAKAALEFLKKTD
jgi:tRNA dimethylallyltransferase